MSTQMRASAALTDKVYEAFVDKADTGMIITQEMIYETELIEYDDLDTLLNVTNPLCSSKLFVLMREHGGRVCFQVRSRAEAKK